MVQLTEAIIKGKTKLDKLAEVRNLNLWGQDITDVAILQHTPHVEILSLSVNGITTLRDFMHCKELKELYLRKNNVASLGDVRFLMPLVHLKVLWLSDNPCAELPQYRQLVVAHLPQLEKLDNVEVSKAEKDAARGLALLQPATSAELAAPDEGCDAGAAEAPDPFSAFAQQHQQQLATAAFVPAPGVQAAPAVMPGGLNARMVGQAAVVSSDGSGCGATISVTVPGRVGATEAAAGGPYDAGVAATHRLPEPQYNPQRYSSQPGTQIPLVLAQTTELHGEKCTQHQGLHAVLGSSAQQHSNTPGRMPGSRGPPQVGSPNVLYAVMALISDLDISQLAIVQKEVEQRLSGQQKAV